MQERLSFAEGIELLTHAPLEELQLRAQLIRNQKNPPNRVTFVLDSNPNYTNVCNVDCSFCAFYRHPGAKDSYTKSVEEVMEHFERAHQAGLTTVLLQGGVNPLLKLDYYVELVKTARERYPHIHPHFFSAVELWQCARSSHITVDEVLKALWEAGLRSLPGGGAEILSERIRLAISPKKMEPGSWIDIHQRAHALGYRSTATMMYGHLEEPHDIVTHLETLRVAQDKCPGFTCFVPWSYKPERTALRRKVRHWAGKDAYFRILSFARIYLDNFDHIGASWFGEGKDIGMQSLHYGADDFGGTLLEENVHRATNWINKTDHNQMLEMIRKAGFEPAQRDTFYNIIRLYTPDEHVHVPHAGQVSEPDCLPSYLQSTTCCPTQCAQTH
ncbi:MAG: dehypoxanthine futalosine cyclase [Verrucomicrobia bacterium]|nr:dehypoxanthine futalosine cyclase [Verrucomicrobiota bacterium]MBS0645088.1 dehypoxanthine futalosine cyclase [Verrucomicrobiota bacterium]